MADPTVPPAMSSPGGVIGNWKPEYPWDPYGTQIFQGGKDWNLAKSGPADGGIPFYQTYGGQPAPYADSTAQILDALKISGVMGPAPGNPLMSRTAGYKPGDAWSWDPNGPHEVAPNQAGRYSFGGGGGYGGAYGLLGRQSGNPNTGGGFQPRAGGGPPPGTPVVTDGQGFTGGGNPNVGADPSQAAWAAQGQGYSRPAAPPTAGNEQLAQIAALGGPRSQSAQQQLYAQLGPMGYSQLMGAVQPQGGGSLLNPSRSAAVSQIAGGMTPQQVVNNPMMGAAGGNYYDLAGNSTGLNPGAAPLGSTSPGTSQAYLTQIAGLLGAGRG